jgi:hypothetical protein
LKEFRKFHQNLALGDSGVAAAQDACCQVKGNRGLGAVEPVMGRVEDPKAANALKATVKDISQRARGVWANFRHSSHISPPEPEDRDQEGAKVIRRKAQGGEKPNY